MATEQLVVFRLSAEEYAVPISHVKEIILYNGATKLPDTPSFLEGMINLRGKIIPVINLAAKFELQAAHSNNNQALIIEMSGQVIGIVVDMVTEVLLLDESAIESAYGLATTSQSIQAIGKKDDRLLIILDLTTLLTPEEMKRLVAAA